MNAASTRLTDDAYRRHIEADSARMAQVLSDVAPEARVPTCPGWSSVQLGAHVASVQQFWADVVSGPVLTAEHARSLPRLPEPGDQEDMLTSLRHASSALVQALAGTDSAAPAWSWSGERSAGFTFRRQAHEACIHRVDAELTATPDGSGRAPIDAMLADDGVDEALRILYAPVPSAAHFTPDPPRMLRLVATDTGTTWLVTMGRRSGTDPDDAARGPTGSDAGSTGAHGDKPHIAVADSDPGDGTVRPRAILSGAAEDLYCTLWRRPPVGALHRGGDPVLVAEFEAFLACGHL